MNVRLADPTLFRTVTLPILKAALTAAGRAEARRAPWRSWARIFGGYSEWGQPVHDVGNDVRILGLPMRRPDTHHAVPHAVPPQQVRAGVRPGARSGRGGAPRARVGEALEAIELQTGRQAASIPAGEFRGCWRRRSICRRSAGSRTPPGRRGRSTPMSEGHVFDELKAKGEEFFTQLTGELMSNPHFVKAMQGRCRARPRARRRWTRRWRRRSRP